MQNASATRSSDEQQDSDKGTSDPEADQQDVVQTPKTVPVQEYFVTVEETALKTPSTLHVVTEETFQLQKLTISIPEAISELPGILVQKTARGFGSPFIRGFTGFRTLLLIDGIRLNNSVFREGPNQYWNTVDSLTIDRIEVIKGPSSVLFGSDAVGGTVNLITAGASDHSSPGAIRGRLFQRVASSERSYIGRLAFGGWANSKLSFQGGISVREYGDLHGGREVGHQPMTGFDELAGDLKFEFFLDKKTRIVAAHQRVDQDDLWRTHKTSYGVSWMGTSVGNEKKRTLFHNRELTYVQLSREFDHPAIRRAKFGFSYQKLSEKQFRIRRDDRQDRQGFDTGTTGVFTRLESPSPLGLLTYGFEFYHDHVNSFRHDFNPDGSLKQIRIQGPVASDSTYDSLGIYLEDEINLFEKTDIVLGVRHSFSGVDAGAVEDPATGGSYAVNDRWNQLVGSARINLGLDQGKHFVLFGGVSQGFRAPNLSDITRFDSARSGEIETPTPGLDPELFLSTEVGLKAMQANWSAQMSYFHTNIDQMIVRVPTGKLVDQEVEITKKNSGEGFVRGVEIDASIWIEEQWTLSASFSKMEGEVLGYPTSDLIPAIEPLSRLQPTSLRLGLDWKSPDYHYWAGGAVHVVDRQDRLSATDRLDTQRIPPGGTPGYTVFHLLGGCRLTQNISLSGKVENVTDRDYRIHGSGLNEPGRNVVIGLNITF